MRRLHMRATVRTGSRQERNNERVRTSPQADVQPCVERAAGPWILHRRRFQRGRAPSRSGTAGRAGRAREDEESWQAILKRLRNTKNDAVRNEPFRGGRYPHEGREDAWLNEKAALKESAKDPGAQPAAFLLRRRGFISSIGEAGMVARRNGRIGVRALSGQDRWVAARRLGNPVLQVRFLLAGRIAASNAKRRRENAVGSRPDIGH